MKSYTEHDEVVDLGDALIETRGILDQGQKDEEDDGRYLGAGIAIDD